MDHNFESLSPERFQELCQVLLVDEFPGLQCLPVGQPDGGRDAVAGPVTFQIKFSRTNRGGADAADWVIAAIENELPKIRPLVDRGMRQYILVTNANGSAHSDSGGVDRVSRYMAGAIEVESQCLWRSDLNRRLEARPEVKFGFPELLLGVDVLRMLADSDLSQDHKRRTRAIQAFLEDQYHADKVLKFKQVELQNDLLGLFVDVPVDPVDPDAEIIELMTRGAPGVDWISGVRFPTIAADLAQEARPASSTDEVRASVGHAPESDGVSEAIGFASVLLSERIGAELPNIVLEGAPGQGKSTVTQYVCQVHRVRLLNKTADVDRVDPFDRRQPLRIPFRVDLRDLAAWLQQVEPFAGRSDVLEPTLETFLAYLVERQSGGFSFTVNDLHDVLESHPVLFVLDGLDEVASLDDREEIVDAVTRGAARLRTRCRSLQIIVTSRPSAFVNSPGFSREFFAYTELANLDVPTILLYADRWCTARDVGPDERETIVALLREKLAEPHLKELARNPMQLAILLSLIATRGASLPDKRTALYDSYVDLFFSREAEKSTVVRDHRALLMDLHRHLAWILHSQGETAYRSGSFTADALLTEVRRYLQVEGHDPSIATVLFRGVVERVVALVQRVEGTYEFEVQPLREYFCARHLYELAPYSPPGRESRGTKPDRFDAIAGNNYWLNVTRFYAGCFSKGELAGLADCLERLFDNADAESATHPRTLALMLLQDWVFSQSPTVASRVVGLLMRDYPHRFPAAAPFSLPPPCGRDALAERLISARGLMANTDRVVAAANLLAANSSTDRLRSVWLGDVPSDERAQGRWIEEGRALGILHAVSEDDVRALPSQELRQRVLVAMLEGDNVAAGDPSSLSARATVDLALDRSPARMKRSLGASSGAAIVNLVGWLWSEAMSELRGDPTSPQRHHLQALGPMATEGADPWIVVAFQIARSLERSDRWRSDLGAWLTIIDVLGEALGSTWATSSLARLGAVLPPLPSRRDAEGSDFFDPSISIIHRVRFAELHRSDIEWWRRQLRAGGYGVDVALLLAIGSTTWGRSVFDALLPELNEVLSDLPADVFTRALELAIDTAPIVGVRGKRVDIRRSDVGERTRLLIGVRASRQSFEALLAGNESEGAWAIRASDVQRRVGNAVRHSAWPAAMAEIEACYARDRAVYLDRRDLTFKAAQVVVMNPGAYPLQVVHTCEQYVEESVSYRTSDVAATARREGWFGDADPGETFDYSDWG